MAELVELEKYFPCSLGEKDHKHRRTVYIDPNTRSQSTDGHITREFRVHCKLPEYKDQTSVVSVTVPTSMGTPVSVDNPPPTGIVWPGRVWAAKHALNKDLQIRGSGISVTERREGGTNG